VSVRRFQGTKGRDLCSVEKAWDARGSTPKKEGATFIKSCGTRQWEWRVVDRREAGFSRSTKGGKEDDGIRTPGRRRGARWGAEVCRGGKFVDPRKKEECLEG